MDNVLKYKDFIGTVNFSAEDGVFYGKIEGIKSMVSFEGETVHDLEEDFKNAVDDYIEHCKANGIELHKSYSGSFNVRIPVELHAKAAAMAQAEGISLNAFVKESLMRAVM